MVALASTFHPVLGALFHIWAQPLPTPVSVGSAAGHIFAGYFFKFGELLSLSLHLALLALWPSGPLALWLSGPPGSLALLALWPSDPPGSLATHPGPPGPLVLLALWLAGPLGPLALLPSGVCAMLCAFVPCFVPLCLALGLCALLWAFAPCFGPLCLALGLVPCFGRYRLACGLPAAF